VEHLQHHRGNGNATMHSVGLVEIHVTGNNIKILSVEENGFYGKFMSPIVIKCTYFFM
jgi:hypothetical protein